MKLLFFNFISKESSVKAFSFPTVPGLKVITPKKRTCDTSSMPGALGSGKDQHVPLLQSLAHYRQSMPNSVPSFFFLLQESCHLENTDHVQKKPPNYQLKHSGMKRTQHQVSLCLDATIQSCQGCSLFAHFKLFRLANCDELNSEVPRLTQEKCSHNRQGGGYSGLPNMSYNIIFQVIIIIIISYYLFLIKKKKVFGYLKCIFASPHCSSGAASKNAHTVMT